MGFVSVLIKLILMAIVVLFVASPLLVQHFAFVRDKDKKLSHRRFRVVLFAILYTIVITVALCCLKDVLAWFESLRFVQWLAQKAPLSGKTVYFAKVIVACMVNFAIGLFFGFLLNFVRIGMKNPLPPEEEVPDEDLNFFQKAERKAIRNFNTETWYFVGRLLKGFNSIASAVYAVMFLLYLFPIMFSADWIPYDIIHVLFSAGYVYPTISLLVLWQAYYFLDGIRYIEEECPELLTNDVQKRIAIEVDLDKIDRECQTRFKDFYMCSVESGMTDGGEESHKEEHSDVTTYIGEAIRRDPRNPMALKEIYLNALDKIVENENSILVQGSFFSEFSRYFLRYVSIILARGDNVVVVCNNEEQVNDVADYLEKGFSSHYSLYNEDDTDGKGDYDDPVWKIVRICGENCIDGKSVSEKSVLVTTMKYLCSDEFERERFVHLISTVIFADVLGTINSSSEQMSILNTRLKHITKSNALSAMDGSRNIGFKFRYMSRQVRYVFFDSARISGLDKVLKNMFSVDLESVDTMTYHSTTRIRCYSCDGRSDGNEKPSEEQYVYSEEMIGRIMNMAILCLAKGAPDVTVFAENALAYKNIAESISSNMGQLSVHVDEDRLSFNRHHYDPGEYSVVLAIDSENNLPAAIRKYTSLVTDKPAMVAIFSRPYMLREYYTENISELWRKSQISRIPVEEGTQKNVAREIVIKANAGGISEQEIFAKCKFVPQFSSYADKRDVNGILREILRIYGFSQNESLDLYEFFEFTSYKGFDENGEYNPEDRVFLRETSKLFDMINGKNKVVLHLTDREMTLPLSKNRLTQNHIAGQNMLYDGNVYSIQAIDAAEGRIFARLAIEGKNRAEYEYVQSRVYRIDRSDESVERVYPLKHVVLDGEEDGVVVSDAYVTAFRAPTEVLTKGYYSVPPHTVSIAEIGKWYHSISDPEDDQLAKETYRLYGNMKKEDLTYPTQDIMGNASLISSEQGALMMSVKLVGQFGENNDRTATLAAIMLNEILHSMFPTVKDAVSVCPVLKGTFEEEEAKKVLRLQPRVEILGKNPSEEENCIELLIVEDCAAELGVVSTLMLSGNNVFEILFGPILQYLNWYLSTTAVDADYRREYLYYGLDHSPVCFDFNSLQKLSNILAGSDIDINFVDIASIVEYEYCDFCGHKFEKGKKSVEMLVDGRRICSECAAKCLRNDKKLLKEHLDRAKRFLESVYDVELDDEYEVCFDSTEKIVNTLKDGFLRRGLDVPIKGYVDNNAREVHVEYNIPSVNLSELIVRQLTHTWQLRNVPNVDEALAEGHIAMVAVKYLRHLDCTTLAQVRTKYYESTNNLSGEGYRKMVRELLQNQQYGNNPFKYLLSLSGETGTPDKVITIPEVTGTGDYGKRYVAEVADRAAPDKLEYFYYARLKGAMRTAYDVILEAIRGFENTVLVEGISPEELQRVVDSIRYDRPELYFFSTFDSSVKLVSGEIELTLIYGADKDEVERLNKLIDEAVPKYLEGIDDTMSAYDVAVRMHLKLINTVDYDSISLREEKKRNGPERGKIDYLRTICGVFINGKVVCEGYARALQYLLQKCGVECAECAGYTNNGTPHAWNIIKADGDYYYIDTTWDDGSDVTDTVRKDDRDVNFFCITTEELKRTRQIDLCPVEMPLCNATRCNYYYHNDLVLQSFDLDKLKAIATEAVSRGADYFMFKCISEELYALVKKELLIDGTAVYEILKYAAQHGKPVKEDDRDDPVKKKKGNDPVEDTENTEHEDDTQVENVETEETENVPEAETDKTRKIGKNVKHKIRTDKFRYLYNDKHGLRTIKIMFVFK